MPVLPPPTLTLTTTTTTTTTAAAAARHFSVGTAVGLPPTPASLLNQQIWGCILIVVQFFYYFLRGYVVTNTYVRIKSDYDGRTASVLAGAAGTVGQVSAALGTLIVFVLVNFTHVFGIQKSS